MASDDDNHPTLEELIHGPREEDFTTLADEFVDEEPMKEPFVGIAKDTGLSYDLFEYYFPDVTLKDRMKNVYTSKIIAALGQAGYDYYQLRKENKDIAEPEFPIPPTVVHFNGKFYKGGGRVHVSRFTLNSKGETVEAKDDGSGDPTTKRFVGLDDYLLPNQLDKLLTESNATKIMDFVEHAKTNGSWNKARMLQVYWGIKNGRTTAVETPHKPPPRDENDVTPPPPGSTMKEQRDHYKGKASAYKTQKRSLQKESSARAVDHSNLCTASVLYAEAAKDSAKATKDITGAHTTVVASNLKKDAIIESQGQEITSLKAKTLHRRPKPKSHTIPQSTRKISVAPVADDDDDEEEEDDEVELTDDDEVELTEDDDDEESEDDDDEDSEDDEVELTVRANPNTGNRRGAPPKSAVKQAPKNGGGPPKSAVKQASKTSGGGLPKSAVKQQVPKSSGGGPPKSAVKQAPKSSGGRSAIETLHAFQAGTVVLLKPSCAKNHNATKGRIMKADPSKPMIDTELLSDTGDVIKRTVIKYTSFVGPDDEDASEE